MGIDLTAPSALQSDPRRRFLRHTVNVPLEVDRVAAPTGELEEGVNVSFGGLAFLAGTCPAVGDTLQLRIPVVDPPFEAQARVAWCRREGIRFLIGVEFLDAADAFRSRMVEQVCAIENYRREIAEREGRKLSPQAAAAEWIEKYAHRFPDPGGQDASSAPQSDKE